MNRPLIARAFTLLLLTIVYAAVWAQPTGKAILKGSIQSADKQPAGNINVLVKGTNKGAITNEQGEFVIKNLAPGSYTLEISYTGLATKQVEVTATADQTTVVPTIVLSENTSELQEVVVVSAASKFAKKQSGYVARMPLSNLENSQVYTVVPKELLQEQVVTDLKSTLQTAPGVTNVNVSVGSGGVGLGIRIRGFSGSSAAGAIRNGMATNWVTLSDPANLERVEVIKGPSGTLFGSPLISYGGLVNRVTKKPFQFVKGEVSYSGGTFGLNRLTADVNAPLNKDKTVLFRANAAYHSENSFQDYGQAKMMVFAPTLTYRVNDKLTLDLDFELMKTRRNTTYFGSIGNGVKAKSFDDLNWDFKYSYANNEIQSSANIFNAYAKASYKLSNTWVSETNYSFASTQNNANYEFILLDTDTLFTRRLMNIPSTFTVNELQQNFIGDFKIGNLRNRLLVGLDYTQIRTTDRRGTINYDKVKINQAPVYISDALYQQKLAALSYSNYNRNNQYYSAYASEVINITDKLLAMASVRVDYFKSEQDNYDQTSVSPKFGVVYQVVKNKVSLFGNYMNGFVNVPPGTTAADPTKKTAFKPEHANQLEGGVKVEVLNGKLSGTLSYYDIQVKDKIRPDPNNPTYSIQDGTQESKGVEADLIANPFKGFHLILGYGYNDSKFTKSTAALDGKTPYATPKNSGTFWASYKITSGAVSGLGFGFGGNIVSDSWANDANTFKVPGYTRLDATAFYETSRFRLSVKVNNLTDQEYWISDFWGAPQATRQFIGSLSYRF